MLTRDNKKLFSNNRLSEALDGITRNLILEINNMANNRIIETIESDLVKFFVSNYRLTPLRIYEDNAVTEHFEDIVDMSHVRRRHRRFDGSPPTDPSVRVTVSIPYSGNFIFWDLMPNQRFTIFPLGNPIQEKNNIGKLSIIINQSTNEENAKEKLRSLVHDQIMLVKEYIDFQKKEIDKFNTDLPVIITRAINRRKEQIGKVVEIVEFLDIPIKKKEDAIDFKPIVIEENIVEPLPPLKENNSIQEYGIKNERYEFILDFIRHVCRTYETTPKTFSKLNEEELRDLILAFLNGYFKGKATGETFRKKGKTDIRVEEEDRAAFISECKVWESQPKLLDAVNQLLGYLTWRDCKTSLIIFNKKTANFARIQEKIPEILSSHPNFISLVEEDQTNSEWRYLFKSAEDESRKIIVHVFLINIYYQDKKK